MWKEKLKSSKLSFLPVIPAVAGILEANYLPTFQHGQYQELLNYFVFRVYLFFGLFLIAGGISLFLLIYRYNFLSALVGIVLCLIPLNAVFLWSSLGDTGLRALFYTASEDPARQGSSTTYAWLAASVAMIVFLIGMVQGYKSFDRRKPVGAIFRGVESLVIAIFPLGVYVYVWDHGELGLHVTNIALADFTNIELLYLCSSLLVMCIALEIFMFARRHRVESSIRSESVDEIAGHSTNKNLFVVNP